MRYIAPILLSGLLLHSCNENTNATMEENEAETAEEVVDVIQNGPVIGNVIKIALLLDTSGSMNGLIEQAKSQLWKIVNQLALAKKGEEYADVQIALYEYGNDGLNAENGYIRQILPLTNDLDEISKELFALSTNGGSEFCGHAISKTLSELEWEKETEGLQVMFIAGNEEFTQGGVDYENACADAMGTDVIVNTIFCGDMEQGIRTKWKHGADLTNGFYGTIEMNQAAVYIETPYDDEIDVLNEKLNATYLAFGSERGYYSSNQAVQDLNSESYGKSNKVERIISKSSHVYKNATWDLVDAMNEPGFKLKDVDDEELPTEMNGMSLTEKKEYIAKNEKERLQIQERIKSLSVERNEYIEQKKAEEGIESNGLDKAMLEAIIEQAKEKNFTFDEV